MHASIVPVLAFAALNLAPQVLADVFTTNPIASTVAAGGQALVINWQEGNSTPTLADIGPCEVGLYAGNKIQQTELQPVAASVDVSKQTSLSFNVDPSIGPNSDAYFIRFTSLALKDPTNPQFPYEAFSSKFTLNTMSGQFSPAVQAQVDGVTSASAGSTSASNPSTTASASSSSGLTTTNASTTAKDAAKTSSSSASASKSTQTSAALTMRSNAGVIGAVGVVATLLGLAL